MPLPTLKPRRNRDCIGAHNTPWAILGCANLRHLSILVPPGGQAAKARQYPQAPGSGDNDETGVLTLTAKRARNSAIETAASPNTRRLQDQVTTTRLEFGLRRDRK